MALFKNREKRTIAQLEDYYANRHSSGKAWAMAFLSLLITVAVLSAIFFGGRWLYRTLTDDDSAKNSDDSSQVEGTVVPGSSIDSEDGVQISLVDPQEATADDGTENTGSEGVVSDEAASTSTPSFTNQTAGDFTEDDSSADESATVTTDESIPDTGAGDILLIAPLLAVVAGYIYSIRLQTEKL